MKICGIVLVLLYAGLMIFAISKEESKSITSLFIATGCLLALVYSILGIVWDSNYIIILIIGMMCISVGTLLNGFIQNNIHIHHHIIRLAVEIIITIICWMGI